MKHLAVLTLLATALTACSGTDTTDTTDTTAQSPEEELPPLMAAAVEELVTENHAFGEGRPPFTEYLIQAQLDPGAGSAGFDNGEGRPLTDAERVAIEDAVQAFGPVRWIEDPDQWRTDDLLPTVEGAAILGVGEPTIDGASASVPVSLWCSGLCGVWLTYQLELVDDAWRVTGGVGPVVIS